MKGFFYHAVATALLLLFLSMATLLMLRA